MVADGKPDDGKLILATDPVAEAGRKIFAKQLRRMKRHEAGSRTGDDIESVHQMRVATRRSRSLFNLIGEYYQAKTVARIESELRSIARALGAIRDLDVLTLDLQEFSSTQSAELRVAMVAVIDRLDRRRRNRRKRLNSLFDSNRYARVLRRFESFSKKTGKGARRLKKREQPHQLRHVLPLLLHERMALVKAYDSVLPAQDIETLHALRVEFKQLRYAIEFFLPVLGSPADKFLLQVKAMQNILGRISDIDVFAETVAALDTLPPEQTSAIESYLALRNEELVSLRAQFDEQWARFNSRATQRLFSNSLLVLR